MEAMGCALPIVSTNVVGIGMEVLACNGGALFDQDGMEEAAAFLECLSRDTTLRDAMGNRCAAHAKRVFHANNLISRYLTMFFPERSETD
jgi:glycosyltransferase involved in cell wall biosynthesis